MNFAENRKAAEEAGLLSSGEYLKLKEGQNRLRLVDGCLPHDDTYQGRKNFKWLTMVIDRADGKVKPFFMPHTIYKQIEELQMNPDYTFETLPMPYDLTISAKKAGTKEVEYTLMPARKESPLTAAERQEMAAAKPLADLQKALREKKAKDAPPPTGALNGDPGPSDDDLRF
jgi:hypothetical protein